MNDTPPPDPDTDLNAWLDQPDPAPALEEAVRRVRRFTTDTDTAPPAAWSAHRDLHDAVELCGTTMQAITGDGPDGYARARAMLRELLTLTLSAADAVAADPVLASRRCVDNPVRVVDVYCETVRQECTLVGRALFSTDWQDLWPITDRWAQVEALHRTAMQVGVQLTRPRTETQGHPGC